MKKILLVIFSLSIIICFIIYSITKRNESNILIVGEINNIFNEIKTNKKNINMFLYNKIDYKELKSAIKNNDYIIIKKKKIYLNQLISKSNIIVINANNIEFYNRCKKEKLNNYDYFANKYLNELVDIIRKINTCKIIIINNNCKNENIKYKLINSENIEFIDIKDVKNRIQNAN